MHSTDIVGYTFNADIYCPTHVVSVLPTGEGEAYDGWALAAGAAPMSAEDNLTEMAQAFGIDRDDESSYDSDDFPKVIFADAVQADDVCAVCSEPLVESDDDADAYDAACPACGELIDYCSGHGEIGDPVGAAILAAHDDGDHTGCDPDGCEDAQRY